MFDVLRREKCDDGSVVFYGLNDSKEKELFAHLEDHVTRSSRQDNPAGCNTARLFFVFTFFQEVIRLTEPHAVNAPYVEVLTCPKPYQSPYLSRLYPPPKSTALKGLPALV